MKRICTFDGQCRRRVLATLRSWCVVAAATASAPAYADISLGLVGHWKLNETSGTTAADSSGNNRTGTYTNTPTLNQTGQCSKAVSFDGVNDYVTIPDNADFSKHTSTGQTVAGWVKVTTIPSSTLIRAPIAAKGTTNAYEWALYVCRSTSTTWYAGASYWQQDGSTHNEIGGSGTFGTGTWVHVAMTYLPGSAVKLYVNGALAATGTTFAGSPYDGAQPVQIGRRKDGKYLNAVLDDVRIYNRVLSADEISELYSLRVHYKLDEASGTVAVDASPYEQDGTVSGTYTFGAAGARYRAMTMNSGGTDGKVSVPNTTINGLTNISSAFWIKTTSTAIQSVFSAANATTDNEFRVYFASSTSLQVFYHNVSQTWTVDSIADGRWHHVAVVTNYSGNSTTVYLDGVSQGAKTISPNGSALTVSSGGFFIGQEQDSVGGTFDSTQIVNGTIDDVRIFAKTLSAAEVADLYGLVGYWKLNETSGTSVADSSGAGNTGAVTGTATWTAAARQNGFSANYTNGQDYIEVANSSSLENVQEGSYSLAGWFKPANYPPGTGSDNTAAYRVIGKSGWHLGILYSYEGYFFCEHWAGTAPDWYGAGAWTNSPPGKWYHLAQVVDRDNGTIKFYLNGVLSQTSTYTAGLAALEYGTEPFRIGVSNPPGTTYAHAANGVIDDVRVYNRVIDDAEVAQLHGLVGRWKLDETSGTTAADSSPAGQTGTYVNSPTLGQTGAYDYAILADGSNDYVQATASTALKVKESVSMAAWVYPTVASATNRTIINKEGEYELALSSTGEIQWGLANTTPGWAWHATGQTVSNNKWTHIAVTYDSGTAKTYVNGVLAETYAGAGNIGDSDTTYDNLRIAGRSNSSTEQFGGKLDEVRVYNRGLQPDEVADLYGFLAHWKMDEASGTTLTDSSPAGVGAAFGTGTPSRITAVRGKGLDFDGTNDAITASAFTPPSEGTIAFWFRSDGVTAGNQRLIGLGGDWEIRQDSAGVVYFDVCADGSTGTTYTTSALATSGTWYHLAYVFDSDDNTYAIYLNGELHKSGTAAADLVVQSAAQLSLGNRTGTTERFAGALDDVRIWNRKLTQAEIYEVFGLLGWYKLDETSGTTAADSTGLGNNGTYVGSPTLGATANGSSTQGTAIALSGSNYVQIPGMFDKSADVAASAWVRIDGVDTGGAEVLSIGDDFGLRINHGATNNIDGFYYNGTTWPASITSTALKNSGWRHVAVSLRGGDTITVYVDGNQVGSASAPTAISYTGLGSNTFIGTHGNTQTTFDFVGRIDDVRFYNRTLQPEEVFNQYRGSRINGVKVLKWLETR